MLQTRPSQGSFLFSFLPVLGIELGIIGAVCALPRSCTLTFGIVHPSFIEERAAYTIKGYYLVW